MDALCFFYMVLVLVSFWLAFCQRALKHSVLDLKTAPNARS